MFVCFIFLGLKFRVVDGSAIRAGNNNNNNTILVQVINIAKSLLAEAPVLLHYDSDLLLCLTGDVSANGVGAAMYHVLPDGLEYPTAFVSCTLTSSEFNYAQVEKEAYSFIRGVHMV